MGNLASCFGDAGSHQEHVIHDLESSCTILYESVYSYYYYVLVMLSVCEMCLVYSLQ